MKIIILLMMIVLCAGCQNLKTSVDVVPTNTPPKADNEVLVVVVHQSNPVQNINWYDLRSIYLKRKRFWQNGKEIFCLHFPRTTEERESFSHAIFKKSAYRMQRYWIRVIEQGYPARPPMEISRANRILAFIHRNKQAIGYVRLSHYLHFKKSKKYRIRAIKINNVQPDLANSQSGKYPLTVTHQRSLSLTQSDKAKTNLSE